VNTDSSSAETESGTNLPIKTGFAFKTIKTLQLCYRNVIYWKKYDKLNIQLLSSILY
jgi:hypothetical protein